MNLDYDEVIKKIKKMVNEEIVGRIVVAHRLKHFYGIEGTEHEIKSVIKYAKTFTDKSDEDRTNKDKKLLSLLKRMNNEFPERSQKPPAEIPESDAIELNEGDLITAKFRSLDDRLREMYGIDDESWVPVSVWGDVRNPMVKWERKRNPAVDNDLIRLRELPDAITILPSESTTERIAVLSIRDVHFGLMTEHPTPYTKYDLPEATKAFLSAANHLMQAAISNSVSKLIIPIGSDLLHVDGNSNTTTKGTRQDTNSFWWEAFDASINAINQVINNAKSNFNEVILVIEPGNHDSSLARAVGIAMKSAWGNETKVSILDNPSTMKRISFGNTHLFMHHGNSIKPALVQSLIYGKHPEVVNAGSYVEVLCGHYHQRSGRKLREAGDYFEFGGMILRITPALCPASNWSESQGYISMPGAQLTIYDEVGFVSLHEWVPARNAGN